MISPPSANRALPVRIYITGFWLFGGLLSLIWVSKAGDATPMLGWGYTTFILMMFALLVTISNYDQISLRVRRTIPQSRLKRALAFVFFNGAAGGLVWVATILIVTFLATETIMRSFPKSFFTSSNETGQWFVTTTTYAFAYALTALFIQRKFLSKRPAKLTGLIAVLLAGAWALVPNIVLFFLNRLSWSSVEGLQLGNIFNVASIRDDDRRILHLYFAFVWLLVMIAINAKWFLRQVKNFQPLVRATPENFPPVLQ